MDMTRTKLKEAALRLFGQKGYDGTALSEIAKEVGVKTPAIYAFLRARKICSCPSSKNR